jgi:ABC-type dipeptide/oligopeptide/nickel transport system permease subunit
MSSECKQKKPDGIDCDMIAKNNIYGCEAAKFAAYKKSNSPVVKKDDTVPSVVPPVGSKEPTGGIVPCGTDSTGPCTLCHFIIGIQKLVEYGLYLVTTMAFVGIFLGGAMYMISTGDPTMIESAKKFIGASVLGFALVLGAWLIVNIILNVMPMAPNLGIGKTNWYTFKCDTISTQGSGTKESL